MSVNRFQLTPENYDEIFKPLTREETEKLKEIERHRVYLSKHDVEFIQCAISTYLEVSDPQSPEHIRLELLGYMFEKFKGKFTGRVRKRKK